MSNKYAKEVMDLASKLDAITNSYGEITRNAAEVVDKQDDESLQVLLKKISDITNANPSKEVRQLAKALKDSIVVFCGYRYVKKVINEEPEYQEDERTLDDLLKELNGLVGLDNVKQQVKDLIDYQRVKKLRRERGFHSTKNTLHMAFTGNPGTGKTTVARIVGHVYKKIGLLSKGHFVEVSRTDLIAGYQGQTALKVKKVIDSARGGVLFIDEAYSITENDHSDSYGRECLTELTKALEDYREDLVVIVAGYTEPMNKFFESNPGLKSRFNTFIEFKDYSANELIDILKSVCHQNDYSLSKELVELLQKFFNEEVSENDEHFANGRLARNIYDDLVMNHARRVVSIANPTDEDLSRLIDKDFEINKYKNSAQKLDPRKPQNCKTASNIQIH
jgi:ATPase, AAA family